MEVAKFQNPNRVSAILHPFKAVREFFRRPLHERGVHSHHRPRFRFGVSFAVAGILVPVIVSTLLFARKVEAKPSAIYWENSIFSYFLVTPVDGMDRNKTNFWVREGGASYVLPFKFQAGKANFSSAVMALGGVTRCEGVPPAETDFFKLAFSPSVGVGDYTYSVGARYIEAQSKEWELQAGPMRFTIPSETYSDWDFSARVGMKKGYEEPGTLRRWRITWTRFRSMQELGTGYSVFETSASFHGGWSMDTQYETQYGNFSVGGGKRYASKDWKRQFLAGAGYEFGANSIYANVGGIIGPVFGLLIYQTEERDKSYHLILAVDPFGFVKSKSPHGAPTHGKSAGAHSISPNLLLDGTFLGDFNSEIKVGGVQKYPPLLEAPRAISPEYR